MLKSVRGILFFFLISSFSYSQKMEKKRDYFEDKDKNEDGDISKPTIGVGTGMLSFYGDLYKNGFQNPSVGRVAYDLQISQYIHPSFQLSLYTLFGKIGANERLPDNKRNLNFESQIRMGGLSLLYNFDHLLPKNRVITPYISTGIESFEFLSKTDLFDKNGNQYHFWSDGSIKSKSEVDPSAATAVLLQRDYTYESDIRELNLDGFGKYKEQAFAIPLGLGVIMHLTDKCDLKIGTTLHHTFTDYIDGVSSNSVGNRKGNSSNDRFVMTSFSLNFVLPVPKAKDTTSESIGYEELLALDADDSDHDGVIDLEDSCQATPEGVPVDKKGCPFDDDKDGVPNYKDQEPSSPKDAFVDSEGVQLTDSLILQEYLAYIDSTGEYAKIEIVERELHGSSGFSRPRKAYTIQLGVFQNGISSQLMTKFLSIPDISSTFTNDSTAVYTSGSYVNLIDAEKRKRELIALGIDSAKIVFKQGNKFMDAPSIGSTTKTEDKKETPVTKEKTSTEPTSAETTPAAPDKVIFRVQLGAYGRKLSTENVFPDMPNLIEIKEEGGLFKYLAGSFNTIEEAARYRVELMTKGYSNSIIAAYKNGQRVTLGSVGATLSNKQEKENIAEPTAPVSAINKKSVVFKVQLGIFKNEPPFDMQYKFRGVPELKIEKTTTGLTRYVAGNYDNYKAALLLKNDIIKNNDIPGAFVVAKFNNEYISLQEAMELVK